MGRSWREMKDEKDKAKVQRDWRAARKAAKREESKDAKRLAKRVA